MIFIIKQWLFYMIFIIMNNGFVDNFILYFKFFHILQNFHNSMYYFSD